jgi:hypothetical protein
MMFYNASTTTGASTDRMTSAPMSGCSSLLKIRKIAKKRIICANMIPPIFEFDRYSE